MRHPAALIYKRLPQPLDRVAILLMLGLSVLIGLLLWSGDRTAPRVQNFSWQDKQIRAEDTAFTLTFNRPMDQASVEASLHIDPPLPGKISWAGRRMAYTLTEPAPYGTAFQVRLAGARDRFSAKVSNKPLLQPFVGRFATRDRAFVYLGVAGVETGRLMLYNFTRQQKMTLTPPELQIDDYEPYPEGDRILFSATSQTAETQGSFRALDPKLYTVSTDIHPKSLSQKRSYRATADELKLVLDNTDYKIHQFDLSPDGETIIVERIDKRQIARPSLWRLKPDSPPELLNIRPGAGFTITPDSAGLVVDLGQGLAIFPLEPKTASRPVYLPHLSRVLGFTRNGSEAAMVKVNQDNTLSLVRVTAQGTQKELIRTTGSIYGAQFSPRKQILYCLMTQVPSGAEYQEQHPYLVEINLLTGKLTPLTTLPKLAAIDLQTGKLTNSVNLTSREDWHISLASDGTALLYAQANSTSQPTGSIKDTPDSNLWLLPVSLAHSWQAVTPAQTQPQPEALPFAGFHPIWIP
jgi:hypothetical protein